MKLRYLTLLLLGLIMPREVYATGGFASNVFVQAIPAESRALIVYDGRKETIFDSVTFNINPVVAWGFDMIIAVPEKPVVTLLKDDLFTKLEKSAEKKISKDNPLNKLLYFDVTEEKNIPASLYTRGIDLVNYKIFGPDNSLDDLKNYTESTGFIIPKTGLPLLEEYRNRKWYFIVTEVNGTHLQLDASESLTVPGSHTLPIKIEFNTDKIIYPLKLTRMQPDYDTLDIPLNYPYGSKSEDILGARNPLVDSMLSYQSKNKYPRVPADYTYHKIDLFVLSDKKYTSKGFTTVFAGRFDPGDKFFRDEKGVSYFELPEDINYLTRLESFLPTIQLEDIELSSAENNRMINTSPPAAFQLLKLSPLFFLILFTIFRQMKGFMKKE